MVIGYGGAGAAAAITTADLGAEVVVLEKQPALRHTPGTRMASIIMAVNDADAAAGYFDRCAGGMIPWAVSRAWAERAAELPDWDNAPPSSGQGSLDGDAAKAHSV